MGTEYWLGTVERDQYGNGWNIKQHDGPHDSPEGVVQAAKIYNRIFKEGDEWVMVVVSELPNIEVEIDEESADICAEAVEQHRIRRGVPASPRQKADAGVVLSPEERAMLAMEDAFEEGNP